MSDRKAYLQRANARLREWGMTQPIGCSYWFSKEYGHHVVTLRSRGRVEVGASAVKWKAIEDALDKWEKGVSDVG